MSNASKVSLEVLGYLIQYIYIYIYILRDFLICSDLIPVFSGFVSNLPNSSYNDRRKIILSSLAINLEFSMLFIYELINLVVDYSKFPTLAPICRLKFPGGE